jgi:hypothetical protein
VVDGLKVLDPERPIREADKTERNWNVRYVPINIPRNSHLAKGAIISSRIARPEQLLMREVGWGLC